MRRNLTIFGTLIFVASLFVALGNAEDTDGNSASEGVTQSVMQSADQLDPSTVDDYVLSAPVGSGALPTDTTSVLVVPTSEQPVVDTLPIVTAPDEYPLVADSEAPPAFDPAASSAVAAPIAPPVQNIEFELYAEQDAQPAVAPATVASGTNITDTSTPAGVTQLGYIPKIQIMTRIPQTIRVGVPSMFEIVAINQGDQLVEDVFVVTALPDWVKLAANETTHGSAATVEGELQWQVGRLAAGERAIWKMQFVSQENRAFQLSTRWTVQPLGLATQVQVIQPELQLSLAGPQEMTYGETKIFTVRVTNTGNGEASDVTLRISPGVEDGQSIGEIAAGGSKLIELELTAEQAGEMKIQAAVSTAGSESVQKELSIVILRPELVLEVEGPKNNFAGAPLTYKIQVGNKGDTIARNVTVNAVLPMGARYLQNGKTVETVKRNMSWEIGIVEPGATRSFEFECILFNEGENKLSMRVESVAAETRSAAVVTRVRGVADLKLIVSDPAGPVKLDEEATYEIQIINRGTRVAHGIDVIAQFGYGVEPVKTTGQTAELIPGQAIFDSIASIAPGEKITLKVHARADKEGRHKIRVKLVGRDPATTLIQEEMTWFLPASTTGDSPVLLEAQGVVK
ncbi:MAG: hypothetical protein HOB73_11430 [Planctomycetaceae bacterium]|jgi:uncharacterized repeat protein (TIGR01451 family)|nr:hypothetical protein [Planctomycetaceae bacterium]